MKVLNKQGAGKIGWTDYTCNIMTGCTHGCPYCAARTFARRFGNRNREEHKVHVVAPVFLGPSGPFPYGFDPTFYPERMAAAHKELAALRHPARIFMCFQGELFGRDVPTEWIEAVISLADYHPQHAFQFLTKNVSRLKEFNRHWPENAWVGTTITGSRTHPGMFHDTAAKAILDELAQVQAKVRFVSFEPMLNDPQLTTNDLHWLDWAIVGPKRVGNHEDPRATWAAEGLVRALRDTDSAMPSPVPTYVKGGMFTKYPHREMPWLWEHWDEK
jgi:protein gp37